MLSDAESRHLRTSLRMEAGAHCLVVDGLGAEARARVHELPRRAAARLVVEEMMGSQSSVLRGPELVVYVGIPQRGKMDSLIEKSQELGVMSVVPLETERTMVRMKAGESAKVLFRWERIAKEAAKQSGALKLLQIYEPISLMKALDLIPPTAVTAIFHPSEDALPFRQWVDDLSRSREKSIPSFHLFFGPEGGFSEGEVRLVLERKVTKIGLGKTLLKVDTAFVGVISSLRFLFS